MTAINRGSDPRAEAEMDPSPPRVPGGPSARPAFRLRWPSSPLMTGVAVAAILAFVIFF